MTEHIYLSRTPTPGSLRVEKELLKELIDQVERQQTRNDKSIVVQVVLSESARTGGEIWRLTAPVRWPGD